MRSFLSWRLSECDWCFESSTSSTQRNVSNFLPRCVFHQILLGRGARVRFSNLKPHPVTIKMIERLASLRCRVISTDWLRRAVMGWTFLVMFEAALRRKKWFLNKRYHPGWLWQGFSHRSWRLSQLTRLLGIRIFSWPRHQAGEPPQAATTSLHEARPSEQVSNR